MTFRAGALLYVVAISVLIALVSSTFILLSFLNRREFDNELMAQRLIRNARSGIHLAMEDTSLVSQKEGRITDLYNEGMDSVRIRRKPWGIFDVVSSGAFFKRNEQLDVVMVGGGIDTLDRYALYLADQNSNLVLCGKTEIRGDCYLPKPGISYAELEGKASSSKLVGKKEKSAYSIPEIPPALPEKIRHLLKREVNEQDSIVRADENLPLDSLLNSFNRKTICFISDKPLVLDHLTLTGNIIILSSGPIRVKPTCRLKDVILVAPGVVLENGFAGSLQVFANDSIHIGEKCSLSYPSVAAIAKPKGYLKDVSIQMGKETHFNGSILLLYEEYDAQHPTEIRMAKEDTIVGQVITNGILQMEGTVYGTVICSSFLLHTGSGQYPNHLLDATIDVTRLPECFAGVPVNRIRKNRTKIIEWLF